MEYEHNTERMTVALRRSMKRFFPPAGRTFIEWAGPRFGLAYALKAYAESLLHPQGLVRVPLECTPGKFVYLRPGISDQYVYDEVFVSGRYSPPVTHARFVIDAGGHIGLTGLFFALRWPGARIVVVEPNASNFSVMRANLAHLPNVRLVHGAIWSHKTSLRIANPDDLSVAFRVEPGIGVPAFTIRDLMRDQGFDTVDLLKIDVEGAEVEMFSTADEWIDTVRALMIELHDRFRPGCRDALLAATLGMGFRVSEHGENTLLVRDIVPAAAAASPRRARRPAARAEHGARLAQQRPAISP
jgi:FkbM family methyltransferase